MENIRFWRRIEIHISAPSCIMISASMAIGAPQTAM